MSIHNDRVGIGAGGPDAWIDVWYVVINDKGVTKSLDFAGFFGTPLARVSMMYVAIAAQTVYAMRLRAD